MGDRSHCIRKKEKKKKSEIPSIKIFPNEICGYTKNPYKIWNFFKRSHMTLGEKLHHY